MGSWLRLLLALGALWGTAAQPAALGALGRPSLLRVPRELQELTRKFGDASWKILEAPSRKRLLLRLHDGNPTVFEPGRLRFHGDDFSLEILNTSRDDGRLYEFSVSRGREEDVWQVQLEVLEPVSQPSIRVLARELSNGSCRLALRCLSERGDAVSYAWHGAGGRCNGTGAVLNLSLPLGTAASGCACTATNAVSSATTNAATNAATNAVTNAVGSTVGSAALDDDQCGLRDGGGPGVSTELVAPLVALGVIVTIVTIVIIVIIVTRRARRDREPSQATPDSAGATIYAQVQKPKGTVPKATPPSCTTIYAAATGPPPAPPGAPRSPEVSPSPRGQPRLAQEPTTVYASVTLPVG